MPRDDDFSAGPYDLSAPPDWAAFPGLYPPLYTQTPDVFFDWVAPFLPEIELRVLLYLIRRTLGFKKQGDQITIDQIAGGIITRDGTRLDWGAQLGERSVQRALSGLEAKGLIERHRQLDPERGWRPSYIRLRLCDQSGQDWQVRGRQAAQPPVPQDTKEVSGQSPATRTARHQAGVSPRTSLPQVGRVQRDTYKKQRSQSTDLQETVPPLPPQETGETPEHAPSRSVWDGIKTELAAVLAPAVYKSRVAPTYQLPSDEPAIVVQCPDGATSRWLERQLGRMIVEIAAGLVESPLPIQFTFTADS
ncbi:MAG: hypothetical protein JWO42_3960 [Chloroflexi bacterium]|nr:hypothetical protein [Chloroflexota bacterium]